MPLDSTASTTTSWATSKGNIMDILLFWLPINLIVGFIVGNVRGRVGFGILLALFLGPIGWLITLLASDASRKCPYCAEIVKPEAKICPHCRKELDGVNDYKRWKEQREKNKVATVEDPVEKWAREHSEA